MALRIYQRRRQKLLPVLIALTLGAVIGLELEHRYDLRTRFVGPALEQARAWTDRFLPAEPAPVTEVLRGRVASVADGDTLTLRAGRAEYRIRLAGIDAPEYGQPGRDQARRALLRKVDGRTIEVRVSDVDRFGRPVGTVWLGERNINREMVREGHAWAYRQFLNDHALLADERTARSQRRGLWERSDPVPPWAWRRR